MSDHWTPEERRLHDAMGDYAAGITPQPGGLADIRARTLRTPWWRRPVTLGLGLATATAAGVIAVTLMLTQPDDVTPVGANGSVTDTTSGPATTSPSPYLESPQTAEPEETTVTPTRPSTPEPVVGDYALPVYYAAQTPAGDAKLAREFQRTETADPIGDAVRQMIGQAADPDYGTLWDPSTEVISAARTADTVVIDLHNPATTGANDELAVQQLVYTATAAAFSAHGESYSTVQVLVDGEPEPVLDTIDLSQPQSRVDPLAVRQLVQIDEPLSGGRYTSPVTVRGSAAAFEGALEWAVRTGDDQPVEEGIAQAEVGQEFSEFSFDVEIDAPGTYVVEVSATDASGGEGPPPEFDTKIFTVAPE